MMLPEEQEKFLNKYELPKLPEGIYINSVRYSVRNCDWYINTNQGWYYCQTENVKISSRKWHYLPNGPLF